VTELPQDFRDQVGATDFATYDGVLQIGLRAALTS
jgi:hypothetical protein